MHLDTDIYKYVHKKNYVVSCVVYFLSVKFHYNNFYLIDLSAVF